MGRHRIMFTTESTGADWVAASPEARREYVDKACAGSSRVGIGDSVHGHSYPRDNERPSREVDPDLSTGLRTGGGLPRISH